MATTNEIPATTHEPVQLSVGDRPQLNRPASNDERSMIAIHVSEQQEQDKKHAFILPGHLPKPTNCIEWVCRPEMRGCQHCWGNPLYIQERKIFMCEAHSPETSQHMFDPFTFDHITTGMIQYAVIPFRGATLQNWWIWFAINFALHLTWEIVENSPCFVQMFRMNEVDQHYTGDSIINSMGDMFAFCIGWWVSLLCVQFVHWGLFGGVIVLLQFWALYYRAGLIPTTIRVVRSIFCKHARVNRSSASDASIRSMSPSSVENPSEPQDAPSTVSS